MVGGPGFEPGASRSRTVRAAGLRQPPLVPKPEFYPDLLAPACRAGLSNGLPSATPAPGGLATSKAEPVFHAM